VLGSKGPKVVSMNTRLICPKCGHNEILHVPQLADRDDKFVVRPLVVHVTHFDWKDDVEVGKLEAYVCRSCGFTELYTHGAKDLPVDKIPGARILRGPKP
jgi:predicted nucleic-acid-binding Zn-ribbon protein